MTWSIFLGFMQVVIGLGFIFTAGWALGREEKWLWVFTYAMAGLLLLIGELVHFLAFLRPMIK